MGISPAKRQRATGSDFEVPALTSLSAPNSNGESGLPSNITGHNGVSTLASLIEETPTTPQTESTMLAMSHLSTAGTPIHSTEEASLATSSPSRTNLPALATAVKNVMPESTLPSAASLSNAVVAQHLQQAKEHSEAKDGPTGEDGMSGLITNSTATTSTIATNGNGETNTTDNTHMQPAVEVKS